MLGAVLVWIAGLTGLYLFLLWRRYRAFRLAELPRIAVILMAGAEPRQRLRRILNERRPAPTFGHLAGFDGPYIIRDTTRVGPTLAWFRTGTSLAVQADWLLAQDEGDPRDDNRPYPAGP